MKPWSVLAVFKTVSSVPTAPFHEASAAAQARAWARRSLGPRVKVRRRRGGLILSYRQCKGPALVLAAHLDHPAFHLCRVTDKGALARVKGGLPREFLKGARIEAFASPAKDNRPLGRGVLLEGKSDRFPVSWTEAPARGRKPVFAMLALPPAEVSGAWLRARSIDDTLGCALVLETLRRVARSRARANLTVILHRAEEVGFIGCLDLIRSGSLDPGDAYISVETSRHMPGAAPGAGPILRTGDKTGLFDSDLLAFLEESAERLRKKGLRFQRTRLTGGTCEATAYQAFGFQAAGLSIPLVNYHNRGKDSVEPEAVRLDDLEPAVRLLEDAALRLPASHLRGSMRKRLTNLHRKTSPLLKTRF
ncbi:MAG: M20/M25/M40 family metallo-hydrolase [Elusimicrobia bacterium]|nr:M20/M25/M40 family metallo-hydrolase [Elusimicrobiota bacterium]